ncbi:MAG: protoporphyrinogen oxidase [Pseudomonadota bacterium]
MVSKLVVIGAGISGLATAFQVERLATARGLEVDVTVIEKSDRLGGKARTHVQDGFRCETGPNGFLDSKPHTLDLCADLGISDRLLPSSDAARKRFIYSEGFLHQLPESPVAFFRSNLLSVRGRLRVVSEPLTKMIPEDLDETVASFGRRHLGSEAVRKLIGPMVSGIFAGDPYALSLKSCFPIMHQLEREGSGSLLVAMLRRMFGRGSSSRKGKGGPAGPGGVLTSFPEGIESLVNPLAAAIRGRIEMGADVREIRHRPGGGWEMRMTGASGQEETFLECDVLILATPSYATAELIEPLDASLAAQLGEILYSPVAVVCLGYERAAVSHPLDGFGFLIPVEEGKSALGCLWDSSMFPGRAPEGHVLLRAMVGGARRPELAALPEDALLRAVRQDLRRIMGLEAEPVLALVFRHPKAIPNYNVGHARRLERIAERLAALPRLLLTGNAYHGIGVNDCTRMAKEVAAKAVSLLG